MDTGEIQKYIYDCSFRPVGSRNKGDDNDPRIKETVLSIIQRLVDSGKFIHYICSNMIMQPDGKSFQDTTQKQQRQRRILFGMWFREFECSELYRKDDFHIGIGTENESYMGFIYRAGDPKIEEYREKIIPFIEAIDSDKNNW